MTPDSFAYLVVTEWGPPLISIVVGGLFASVLFPRWQSLYNQTRAVTEARFKLIEDIAVQFASYVTAWRRLLQISELERDRPLNEYQRARKQEYISQRMETRDDLFSSFARGQLYFSRSTGDLVREFIRWDEAQATKTIDELPDLEEWRRWEDRIILKLKKDERRRGFWRQ